MLYSCETWKLAFTDDARLREGEECVKKDLERYGLRREDTYYQKKWRERIRAKIANSSQPR